MAEGEGEAPDKESQTEEPTEKRLRDARKEGDVPASRETGNLMSIFSLFVLTVFVLPQSAGPAAQALSGIFASAGQITVGEGSAGLADVGAVLRALAWQLALPVLPIFGLMIGAALFGVMIQGETVAAPSRLQPKLSKISPLQGFKRLFSFDALIEFAKSMAKVLVLGGLALWFGRQAVLNLWQAEGFLPEHLPAYIDRYAALMLIAATVFMVPVTLADILWRRFSWFRKNRMTLKQLRDEHKDSEGDPHLRARRDQIRRRRARQRMTQAVPGATLVLTNPTHYAVALRYEQGVDEAPVCVAKGADLMARRIRELAHENDVPVIENRPLARALHARVEVDDVIPAEHWQAVAEIVGYVFDLRRNIRRKPPKGSERRLAAE